MSQTIDQAVYTQQLDPDEAALPLVDHQVGMFAAVRDYSVAELKRRPRRARARRWRRR